MAGEPEGAAFEPVRVGAGTRRAPGLLAVWLAALAGTVGIAAVNVPAGDDVATSSNPPSIAPTTVPAVAPAQAAAANRPIAIIEIVEARSLDPDDGRLQRRLEVTGRLLVRADRVRITLEGREDRILATLVRHPIRLPPRQPPAVDGAFGAAFELPADRIGGVWITVTAFDEHGVRLGRVRQRVEIFPIVTTSEWK
ncbi:MAG: hypothetical protein FIA92_18065 [Chloroflexi bacterium]|nr:hypothetical protein [Chloroflexota bacterium]